jgi:hypothetical protein
MVLVFANLGFPVILCAPVVENELALGAEDPRAIPAFMLLLVKRSTSVSRRKLHANALLGTSQKRKDREKAAIGTSSDEAKGHVRLAVAVLVARAPTRLTGFVMIGLPARLRKTFASKLGPYLIRVMRSKIWRQKHVIYSVLIYSKALFRAAPLVRRRPLDTLCSSGKDVVKHGCSVLRVAFSPVRPLAVIEVPYPVLLSPNLPLSGALGKTK